MMQYKLLAYALKYRNASNANLKSIQSFIIML